MPKCAVCGATAFYRTDAHAYCKAHHGQAVREQTRSAVERDQWAWEWAEDLAAGPRVMAKSRVVVR